MTFRELAIDRPHPGRSACICIVITDCGRTLSLHSDHITPFYPVDAVATLLQDVASVARSFATDTDRPLSSFCEIAGRYSSQIRIPGAEMEEFVVCGSAHIPSRKGMGSLPRKP